MLLLSFTYSAGEVDISAKAIYLEMSGLPMVAGEKPEPGWKEWLKKPESAGKSPYLAGSFPLTLAGHISAEGKLLNERFADGGWRKVRA